MNKLEIEIRKGEERLKQADPVLGDLIKRQEPIVYLSRGGYFYSLCRSIVGQQVSMAAARAIFNRLEEATELEPEKVAALSEDEMRRIGLSRQKMTYISDLAEHFASNPDVYNHLETLGDEEVIKDLTAIKGIGVWSAQMFLMFTLARLDVFAPDDIGLQRAMKNLYGWKELPKKAELEKFALRWKPYRTVASWHLWKSLGNTP